MTTNNRNFRGGTGDGLPNVWAELGIGYLSDLNQSISDRSEGNPKKEIKYKVFTYDHFDKSIRNYMYSGIIKITGNHIIKLLTELEKPTGNEKICIEIPLYTMSNQTTTNEKIRICVSPSVINSITGKPDNKIQDSFGNRIYLHNTAASYFYTSGGRRRKTHRKKRNSKKLLKSRRRKP
jgi:hypothetical protein